MYDLHDLSAHAGGDAGWPRKVDQHVLVVMIADDRSIVMIAHQSIVMISAAATIHLGAAAAMSRADYVVARAPHADHHLLHCAMTMIR
jgi:hypothetical protein